MTLTRTAAYHEVSERVADCRRRADDLMVAARGFDTVADEIGGRPVDNPLVNAAAAEVRDFARLRARDAHALAARLRARADRIESEALRDYDAVGVLALRRDERPVRGFDVHVPPPLDESVWGEL